MTTVDSSDPMCSISITRKYAPYTVDTETKAIKDYHDTIFGGVVNPLCKEIMKFNGRHVEGCQSAAAFTSWQIKTSKVVYGAAKGRGTKSAGSPFSYKQPYSIRCHITTALPQWSHIDATTAEEREEVRRFELRTAYHERGHGLACESVAQAIRRFVSRLPQQVPKKNAAALNDSVRRVVQNFYLAMGRKADVAYDAATGHGLTQGAEAKDRVST